MSEPDRTRKLLSIVVQIVVAIAILFVVFGLDRWSSGAWALLTIYIVWIALYTYESSSNENTRLEYWNAGVHFVLALVALAWSLWSISLWGIAVSVFLVATTFSDIRFFRARYRKTSLESRQ